MPPTFTRTPSDEGPPGCWGRFRGDAQCDECPFAKRCEAGTARLRQRLTVAQAVKNTAPTFADLDETAELLRLASRLAIARGLKKPFKPWGTQSLWHEAMTAIMRACRETGWPARQYVRAQVQMLTPIIERGWPLKPGHFVGEKADERFQNWVIRRSRTHGDPTADRSEKQRSALEKRQAAACIFGTAYLGDDRTRSEADIVAHDMDDGWSSAGASQHEKLLALSAALAAVDTSLPHRVLVADSPSTWKQIRRAFRALVWSQVVPAGSPSGLDRSLGELV